MPIVLFCAFKIRLKDNDKTYSPQQVLTRAWKDTISSRDYKIQQDAKRRCIQKQMLVQQFHDVWIASEFFCVKVGWGDLRWQHQPLATLYLPEGGCSPRCSGYGMKFALCLLVEKKKKTMITHHILLSDPDR